MITRREMFGLGLGLGFGGGRLTRYDHAAIRSPEPEPGLLARLRAMTVHTTADIGPVLYSWTTRRQIDAIASDREVGAIFRASTDVGRSWFREKLSGHPDILGVPVSGQLRFGWTNPWAALRGWYRSRRPAYGDQLLRLELRETAEIAWLRTSPLELLRASPRPTVVLHEIDRDNREVVVLSADALASWSYGTAEIRSELIESAELLEALARRAPFESPELARAYRACLAFDNDNVATTPAQLQTTADLLRAAAGSQGTPMEANVSIARCAGPW